MPRVHSGAGKRLSHGLRCFRRTPIRRRAPAHLHCPGHAEGRTHRHFRRGHSYTDPENEAVIQSALAKLVQGKTLLVIAHRLSTIADADQIIVVNQGRIDATGTQDELLASCPLYQTMWEAHISIKDDGEVA